MIALAYLGRFDSMEISQISHKSDNRLTGVSMAERHKNAFINAYDGKTGYLYIVDDENFKSDQTEWSLEVVSEDEVDVIDCIKIDNALDELKRLSETGDGQLRLYYYPDRPDYMPSDDRDMIDAALESYEISKNIETAKRYFQFYPQLKEKIVQKFLDVYSIDLNDGQ